MKSGWLLITVFIMMHGLHAQTRVEPVPGPSAMAGVGACDPLGLWNKNHPNELVKPSCFRSMPDLVEKFKPPENPSSHFYGEKKSVSRIISVLVISSFIVKLGLVKYKSGLRLPKPPGTKKLLRWAPCLILAIPIR